MVNPKLGHPVVNKNKVSKKQWSKWSNHAKRVFNDVYHAMRSQTTVTHPAMYAVHRDHWHTIQWNSAWLAADAANKNGGATEAVKVRPPNKELRKATGKKRRKRVPLAAIIKATRALTLKSIAKKKKKFVLTSQASAKMALKEVRRRGRK